MAWIRDHQQHEAEERLRLRSSLILAVSALSTLVIIGTVAMRHLEHWSWLSSFYFSVTTLATVAYGDLYPTHDLSRLFTSLYVITGVTTALTAMTIVGRNYLGYIERKLLRERLRERRSQRTPEHVSSKHRGHSSP
ncbi:MAG: potassium channel family protein [Flavobacteriales bacterium]